MWTLYNHSFQQDGSMRESDNKTEYISSYLLCKSGESFLSCHMSRPRLLYS